jgi:hypothetical protein
MSQAPSTRYRFGDFCLDVAECHLLRSGVAIPLCCLEGNLTRTLYSFWIIVNGSQFSARALAQAPRHLRIVTCKKLGYGVVQKVSAAPFIGFRLGPEHAVGLRDYQPLLPWAIAM